MEGITDTFVPDMGDIDPIGFVPGKLLDKYTFRIVEDYRLHGITPVCAGDRCEMRDGTPGIVLAFRQMAYPGGKVVIVAKCPVEAVAIADAMTGTDRMAEYRSDDPRGTANVYGNWIVPSPNRGKHES